MSNLHASAVNAGLDRALALGNIVAFDTDPQQYVIVQQNVWSATTGPFVWVVSAENFSTFANGKMEGIAVEASPIVETEEQSDVRNLYFPAAHACMPVVPGTKLIQPAGAIWQNRKDVSDVVVGHLSIGSPVVFKTRPDVWENSSRIISATAVVRTEAGISPAVGWRNSRHIMRWNTDTSGYRGPSHGPAALPYSPVQMYEAALGLRPALARAELKPEGYHGQT
jgi:hypothetical protein